MVAGEMVEKLGLVWKKHVQAYKLFWIQKGYEVMSRPHASDRRRGRDGHQT